MRLINILRFTLLLVFILPSTAYSSPTISLGSSKALVKEVHGEPSEIISSNIHKEIWRYGYSTVLFKSLKGKKSVAGWENTGNLKITLKPKNKVVGGRKYFTRGSHTDDVLRVQGTPGTIWPNSEQNSETWRYGYSTVTISIPQNTVTDWSNNGNLKVQLLASPEKRSVEIRFFTIGSSKEDVIHIQGTPSAISNGQNHTEFWRYGYDTVTISLTTGRVTGWNSTGRLKVKLHPDKQRAKLSSFELGSNKDEVLQLQGTPHGIRRYPVLGFEIWRYGYSTVTLSLYNGKVSALQNNGNLLISKNNNSSRHLKYHSKKDGLTLFFDENLVYGNIISFNEENLGKVFGITKNKIISFYDQNFQPLDLYVYLLKENTLGAVSPKGSYSEQWLTDFSKTLEGTRHFNGVTLYNIVLSSGSTVTGESLDFKSISVDTFSTQTGQSVTGTRIKLGDLILGNWWADDGSEMKGVSKKVGKITVYQFTMPDGEVVSGTTLDVGNLSIPGTALTH